MGIVPPLLAKDGYRHLTVEDTPHLVGCVERLAQKARLTDPVHVYFYAHDKPVLAEMIGAIGKQYLHNGHGIVVGESIIKGAFGFEHLKAPVTPEIEAILAHEIGHLKKDMGAFGSHNMARAAPYVGILAGIAAMACLEHHFAKKKEKDKQQVHSLLGPALHPAAQAAAASPAAAVNPYGPELFNHKHELNLPPRHEQRSTVGMAITVGKLLAAAAIGYTGGVFASKAIRHRMEFRADKFSAELMGDAEPMQRALAKLGAYMREFDERRFGHLPAHIKESLHKQMEIYRWFLHPTIPKRIENLGGPSL